MESPRKISLAAIILTVGLLHGGRLSAQTDYQWLDTTSGGLWATPANWSPSGPASGSASAADFSTLVLPANNTVHLNLPETIGSLFFGDQGNDYNWTLDNNGSAANGLTLAGNASVTASNGTATIIAGLRGGAGLTVYGGSLFSANVDLFNPSASNTSNVASASIVALNPAQAESYSGVTTVAGGTLLLDFSNLSTPTNLVSASSALVLGGGTLAIVNSSGAVAASQTFNGAALNVGSSSVSVMAANISNPGSMLALGAIARNVGATVNFNLPTTGSITTTTANTSGTILGGWAVANGNTWAVSAGNGATAGAIFGLSAGAYSSNTFGSGLNTSITSNYVGTSDVAANSLTFNASFGGTGLGITGSTSNYAITLSSGGILVTPSVSVGGATIAGGTGGSVAVNPSGNELIVNQYDNNGTFFFDGVNSSSTLTKNGPGTMFVLGGITATNLYINQGIISTWTNWSPAKNTVFTGNATWQYVAATTPTAVSNETVTINAGVKATIDNNLAASVAVNQWNLNFTGAGSLAYTSSTGSTLEAFELDNVTANGQTVPPNNYQGSTTIYGGQLRLLYTLPFGGNVNKLNPAAPLYLGGVMSIAPNAAGTTQTTDLNLDLMANSGSGIYETNAATLSGNSTISLTNTGGTVVRSSGSTVAFGLQDTTHVALHFPSGLANSSTGMIGGWAVYGAVTTPATAVITYTVTDWAGLNGSDNVVSLISAGGSYAANSWSAGSNTDITSASNSFSGTTNSLRFNTSGAQTVTLASGSSIASGGILVTANVGGSTTTITGGTLTSGNGQDLIVNQYNTSGNLTISSRITGSIGLTLSGNTQATAGAGGLLILANSGGNNNYTGGTAIDAATTLEIGAGAGQQIPTTSAVVLSQIATLNLNGNSQSIGSLASISFGASVVANGAAALTVGNDNSSTTYNGTLNGGMALVKVGTGTLTLGDDGGTYGGGSISPGQDAVTYLYSFSTYSGGTVIDNGTISILADSCLGNTSGSVTINGATTTSSILQATGTFTSNRTIQLGPASGSGFGAIDVVGGCSLTLGGAIGDNGGAGTLVKIDRGALLLTNNGNTYSGGTIITAGILNISSDGTLGETSANPNITFNGSAASGGGTLQFAAAYSGTSLGIPPSGNRNILVAAGSAGTIDTNGNNITYAGTLTIQTSSVLTKADSSGAGTFEIDSPPTLGNNSALAVTGGILRLNYGAGVSIGSGVAASVSGSAKLELAGSSASQLSSAVNITNNSTASVPNASTAGGGLYVSGGSQIVGTINGSGNTVVGTVSSASLTAYQIRQNSLTIGSGAIVTLRPSGSGSTTQPAMPNNVNFSSSVTSLNIAGTTNAWTGTLDIGNNGLVIAYGTLADDPYTTINNMVESGYNGGYWTSQPGSTGITSTLAGAGVAMHIATPLNIGLLDFTPGTGNYSNTTFISFEGQTVTTNAILVRLTYMDDLVLAGDMASNDATSDALLFAANYGTGTTWGVGDLVHNGGPIDSSDALLFAANYVVGLPSLDGSTGNSVALAGTTAAVPEPSSVALGALGALGLGLLARHWRRG